MSELTIVLVLVIGFVTSLVVFGLGVFTLELPDLDVLPRAVRGVVVVGNVDPDLFTQELAARAVKLRSGAIAGTLLASTVSVVLVPAVAESLAVPDPIDLDILQLLQQVVHVGGDPRDQLHQLSVSTELRTILLLDKLRQPPVSLLEPDQRNQICVRERHRVASGRSSVATASSIGRSEMLVEVVVDPGVENEVILIWSPLEARVLQQAAAVELEVVRLVDHLLDVLEGR